MDRNEMIEKMLRTPPLGPDDKFRFYCTACGDCCYNPEGIILAPSDIYRGAKYLGIPVGSFIIQYCTMYIGSSTHFPLLTLKMEGYRNKCVFLDDRNKCRIHKAKPGVCETFPLGRMISEEHPDIIEYRLQPIDCCKRCKEYTVREWLSGTGFETSNELYIAWGSKSVELCKKTMRLHKALGDDGIELLAPKIAFLMYSDYDTGKEFMPQYEENCRRVAALLEMVDDYVQKESENAEEVR